MTYFEFKKLEEIQCDACGWKGKREEADIQSWDTFLDVRCPKVDCDKPILKIIYPTYEEYQIAAEEGDQEAKDQIVYLSYLEHKKSAGETANMQKFVDCLNYDDLIEAIVNGEFLSTKQFEKLNELANKLDRDIGEDLVNVSKN